jgi:hypothetical protein
VVDELVPIVAAGGIEADGSLMLGGQADHPHAARWTRAPI